MGKKGYGKRIMRLDKQDRRDISGTGEAGGPRGRQGKGGGQQAQVAEQLGGGQSNMHLAAMLQLAQAGPKQVSKYSNKQRVLIVGDGDFSFSLSVASSVGGSNIVCTSLDKRTQVQVKYGQGVTATLQALERMGATLLHQVDATRLSECKQLAGRRFDRIVFNFPDLAEVSPHEEAKEPPTTEPLASFLASATGLLQRPGGEIHVAVRSRDLATLGLKVKEAASPHGLECGEVSAFQPSDFMGYKPRHTYPNSPKAVSLVPAKLLVFRCVSNEAKRKRREEEEEAAKRAAAEEEESDAEEGGEDVAPGPKRKKKKKRRTGWDDAKKDDPWLKPPKAKESKAVNSARSAVAALFGR